MSPEAQRVAIAEACGISVEPCTCANGLVKRDAKTKRHLADYPNDLNAMHEAEKVFLVDTLKWQEYESNLRNVTLRDGREGGGLYERLIHSTASQRAEAFLKVIGKWEDGK